MALSFGGGTASISELIAKKNYAKAIDAIKAQLKAGKQNPQLLNQLADVLILAKKDKEAIQILMRVADEYAAEGWDAKAIAVLKKIDRLEPGRRDVQAKLSSLVKDKRGAAAPASAPPGGGGGGFEIGMEEIGFEAPGGSISVPGAPAPQRSAPPPPRPPAPPPRPPRPEALDELPSFSPQDHALNLDLGDQTIPAIALEDRPKHPAPTAPKPAPAPVQDFDFGGDDEEAEPTLELLPEPESPVEIQDIQLEPEVTAEPEPEVQLEPEAEAVAVAPASSGGGEFDDLFAEELMGAIDEAFGSSPPAVDAAAQRRGPVQGDFMSSPLFQGFSPDELVAILEGLTLHNFEPGEIILTQGAPGHSLFILTTGMVRAYVKDEHAVYRFVRDLEEGSFFGEFAVVTGQPRAATITAATRCELLELDRGTLDAISISHPHVNVVLRQHYEARMKGK